jgi:hypothetical protein
MAGELKALRDALFSCKQEERTYDQVGKCDLQAIEITKAAIVALPDIQPILKCLPEKKERSNFIVDLAKIAEVGSFDLEDIEYASPLLCDTRNEQRREPTDTNIDQIELKDGSKYLIKHSGTYSTTRDLAIWSSAQLVASILGEDVPWMIWANAGHDRFAMTYLPIKEGTGRYIDHPPHEIITSLIFESLMGDKDRYMNRGNVVTVRDAVIGHLDFASMFTFRTGPGIPVLSPPTRELLEDIRQRGVDAVDADYPGLIDALYQAKERWPKQESAIREVAGTLVSLNSINFVSGMLNTLSDREPIDALLKQARAAPRVGTPSDAPSDYPEGAPYSSYRETTRKAVAEEACEDAEDAIEELGDEIGNFQLSSVFGTKEKPRLCDEIRGFSNKIDSIEYKQRYAFLDGFPCSTYPVAAAGILREDVERLQEEHCPQARTGQPLLPAAPRGSIAGSCEELAGQVESVTRSMNLIAIGQRQCPDSSFGLALELNVNRLEREVAAAKCEDWRVQGGALWWDRMRFMRSALAGWKDKCDPPSTFQTSVEPIKGQIRDPIKVGVVDVIAQIPAIPVDVIAGICEGLKFEVEAITDVMADIGPNFWNPTPCPDTIGAMALEKEVTKISDDVRLAACAPATIMGSFSELATEEYAWRNRVDIMESNNKLWQGRCQ